MRFCFISSQLRRRGDFGASKLSMTRIMHPDLRSWLEVFCCSGTVRPQSKLSSNIPQWGGRNLHQLTVSKCFLHTVPGRSFQPTAGILGLWAIVSNIRSASLSMRKRSVPPAQVLNPSKVHTTQCRELGMEHYRRIPQSAGNLALSVPLSAVEWKNARSRMEEIPQLGGTKPAVHWNHFRSWMALYSAVDWRSIRSRLEIIPQPVGKEIAPIIVQSVSYAPLKYLACFTVSVS